MGPLRKGSPGPVARRAFRTGVAVAAGVGLLAVGLLYRLGTDPTLLAYLLLVGFPFYLVLAAAAVNSWLGYGGEAYPLEPVAGSDGATAPTDGQEAGTEESTESPVSTSGPGNAVVRTPRVHVALILGAVATGAAAGLTGRPVVAFYLLLFAFFVVLVTLSTFVWPRLETYFERGGLVRSDPRDRALSPELKAGATVALAAALLFVLSVGAVSLLR